MQKIILDTNVIVSALISTSFPSKILHEIVFARKVTHHISNRIIQEYVEVLSRDKFDKFPNFRRNAEVFVKK